jgi:Uncharacterised nucleotidyltransferase
MAPLPPAAKLQPTLSMVTERLARELASPTETAPDWADDEWTIARAVAAMHGISPLLSRSLPWRGPPKWGNFLDDQRTHTRLRHERMQALLRSIDQRARECGIGATALKGAALHRLGLYVAGDRPMADIDLLVRPVDVQRAAALLNSLGFQQSSESWKERVFTPCADSAAAELGEHAHNSLKIELHERICERLPWNLTDVSESIFPAQPKAGLNEYPSKGALMRHLLLHAAGSMAFQNLRILQLHDIALLAGKMADADWKELSLSSASPAWWAFPPLELASRYYPSSVPARFLAVLESDCSYFLRALGSGKSLVDVSHSYLWVRAFPGIEWSQSIVELIGYAVSRVRPDVKHMARRKQATVDQVWARQNDWSSMPQGRRIVRWLTTRQTRPSTMHVISAAFAQAQ